MQIVEHTTLATRALDRHIKNPEQVPLDVLKSLIVKEARDAAQQRSKAEDELLGLKLEIDGSRREVANLREDGRVQSELLEKKNKQIDVLQEQWDQDKSCNEQDIINLRNAFEIREFQRDEEVFERACEEMREEILEMEDRLNFKEYDLEICRDDLEDCQDELEICRNDLKDCRAVLEERSKEVHSLEAKVESLEKLAAERIDLRARIEDFEKLLNKKVEDEESAQKEITELKLKLTVRELTDERTTQDLMETAQKEVKEMNFKYAVLKAANDHTIQELKQCRDELSDWKLQTFCNSKDFGLMIESSLNELRAVAPSLELMAAVSDKSENIVCRDSLI